MCIGPLSKCTQEPKKRSWHTKPHPGANRLPIIGSTIHTVAEKSANCNQKFSDDPQNIEN